MKLSRGLVLFGAIFVAGASTLSAQGVTCKDGSKSAGGRGACSGHGGIMVASARAKVAEKHAAKAEVKAQKADAKAAKAAAKAEVKADAKAAKVAAKAEARADDRDARGATAECRDHYFSHAAKHQGACSRHGGVARFLDRR